MSPLSQNEKCLNQRLKADSKVTYVCASSALKKQLGQGAHERLGRGSSQWFLGSHSIKEAVWPRAQGPHVARDRVQALALLPAAPGPGT